MPATSLSPRVQSETRLNTLLRPVVDDAVRGVLGRYSLRHSCLSEQRAAIIGRDCQAS
jgi:hypothetical protein